MADTSLIFNIIARDKTAAAFEKMEKRASSLGKTMAFALGPALIPAAASGTIAAISLGNALAGAGLAAGVFGAVTKTAMSDVTDAATKVSDLNDKVALYGREAQIAAASGQDNSKQLKKQAEATLELKARLANLPPATRDATMAYLGMKNSWQSFVETNKPAVFGLLQRGYNLLNIAIQHLQPFFDMGASAANRLVTALEGGMGKGDWLDKFAKTAAASTSTLVSIVLNLARGFGHLFGAVGSGQGQGILNWIDQMTFKFEQWTASTKKDSGLNKLIDYARTNGPTVVALLGNIATAAVHIAQATAPIAPVSMAIASALGRIVAAIPVPVITALVAGFVAFNIAMKAYALYTSIATAVQWAMNAAWLASPITWIVLAIVALVAIIVLVATKTRFFQTIWAAVWGFMKGVGAWFAGPFANFFVAAWHKITSAFTAAKNWIGSAVSAVGRFFVGMWNTFNSINGKIGMAIIKLVGWFRALPGRIGGGIRSLFNGLWEGFRGNVNRIIGAWNNLSFHIGGGSFMGLSIPSFTLSTPNLPYMATGGQIMRDGLIFAHAGETVTKKAEVSRRGPGTGSGGGRGGATITINGSNTKAVRVLLELLREGIRDQGGDPVKVLTAR